MKWLKESIQYSWKHYRESYKISFEFLVDEICIAKVNTQQVFTSAPSFPRNLKMQLLIQTLFNCFITTLSLDPYNLIYRVRYEVHSNKISDFIWIQNCATSVSSLKHFYNKTFRGTGLLVYLAEYL